MGALAVDIAGAVLPHRSGLVRADLPGSKNRAYGHEGFQGTLRRTVADTSESRGTVRHVSAVRGAHLPRFAITSRLFLVLDGALRVPSGVGSLVVASPLTRSAASGVLAFR